MSEHYDLTDIMNRLPYLQQAALAAIGQKCDAVSYWPHQQESFPYWTNRIDSMTIETDMADDIDIHRYQITMALVVGHLLEGYKGEPTERAYLWIPAVLDYFRQHRNLTDGAEYRAAPDFLYDEPGGATITGIPNGTRPIQNAGVEGAQIAVLFTLDVPLVWRID